MEPGEIKVNKYLEKLANNSKARNSISKEDYTQSLAAGGIGGMMLGDGLTSVANKYLRKEVDAHDSYGGHTVGSFYEAAKKHNSKLKDVELIEGSFLKEKRPHFMPKFSIGKKLLNASHVTNDGSNNVGVFAHELGHAASSSKSGTVNLLRAVPRVVLSNRLAQIGVVGSMIKMKKLEIMWFLRILQ